MTLRKQLVRLCRGFCACMVWRVAGGVFNTRGAGMIAKLKHHLQQARDFITGDLWFLDLRRLPATRRKLYGLLRILQIVGRDFIRDNCALQASALTYITLMSMVPMLAMLFSFAKGLGAQEWLLTNLAPHIKALPEQISGFVFSIFELVERTNFLTLGAIGTILLFWTVIKVMGHIEYTFNKIWGIQQGRVFFRKCADYTLILVVVPFFVITAFTVNATLESEKVENWIREKIQVSRLTGKSEPATPAVDAVTTPQPAADSSPPAADAQPMTRTVPGTAHTGDGLVIAIYKLGLRLLGVCFIVVGFTFLYSYLPNTRVQLLPALMGGLVAGLAWLGWQWACINVQVLITRWNTIYGAFATLPITLFWLNTNWIITLLGAEIAFATQNYSTYVLESEVADMSYASKRRLAYLVMFDICRAHRDGRSWSPVEYQEKYNVPIRLIQTVLHTLAGDHLVVESTDNTYVPGRDITRMTLLDLEDSLEGEAGQRTTQLAARLGRSLEKLLGQREETRREALAKTTFAAMLDEHETTVKP